MKTITFKTFSKSFFAVLLIALIGMTGKVEGAAISAAQSGDWNATATWVDGVVPGSADDVTITGFTVTVSDAQAAKSVIVQSSETTVGKLIVQETGTLTASTTLHVLILRGGEVENAGTINLTTTDVTAFQYCISFQNTGVGMLVNAGKYSGAGSLVLNSSTSTSGGGIGFVQSNAESVFTVGGSYTFSIAAGRPLFNVGLSGKGLVTGTGTITVGTSGAPAAYGITILAGNDAQLTIGPDIVINTFTSFNTTKRGPIYFAGATRTVLTNKGTINIQGAGANAIGSVSSGLNTLVNEGSIAISGAFTESAIGINITGTNVLNITNSGTISISGLPTGVTALATPGTQGYFNVTNNTNGVLDINNGSAEIVTGPRTRLKNYGGTVKGSGIYNGSFEAETGILSPGGSGIGKITIAKLQLLTVNTDNLTGQCVMDINGNTAAGTDFDQIVFTQATVDISGATLETKAGGAYTPVDNDAVSLITANTTRSGNFSSVTLPSLNWSVDYANTTDAKLKFSETASTTIASGTTISLTQNTSLTDLTINSGGTLTVNPGKQITINTTFSNSGTLNLLSDGTSGTATIITPEAIGGSGAAYNVQQYITSSAKGVAGRNWYISSPLSEASSSVITTATGNGLVYWNGTAWTDAGESMEVMKGYIAKSPEQNTTINFTGGTLNTGDKSATDLPIGFNLVGNPYASYVDFAQATRTNVEESIWYRSKRTGSYVFQTYNVPSNIGANDGTAIIPPMQSFWIKTTSATNTLGFTNTMRSHQDQSVLTNRLKAPKASTQQLLRLQVSNATNSDETVLYFNTEAQNTIDGYDSQKMFNNISNVPEIYTRIGATDMVINGMSTIPYNTEIPLGFSTGEAGNFSINASEFKNFESGTSVLLKDKLQPATEIQLNEGAVYHFSSQLSTGTDRFSLIFRAPGTTTGVTVAEKLNAQVFVNADNQITIIAPEKCSYVIYNAVGQKVEDGITASNNYTSNIQLSTGIYVVRVSDKSKEFTSKLFIK